MSDKIVRVVGVAPPQQGYIFDLTPPTDPGFYRLIVRVVPNTGWTSGPVSANGTNNQVSNVPGFGTFQMAFVRAADCDAGGTLLTSYGFATLFNASDGS